MRRLNDAQLDEFIDECVTTRLREEAIQERLRREVARSSRKHWSYWVIFAASVTSATVLVYRLLVGK